MHSIPEILALAAVSIFIAAAVFVYTARRGAGAGILRLELFSSALFILLFLLIMLLGISVAKLLADNFPNFEGSVFLGTAFLQVAAIAGAVWFSSFAGDKLLRRPTLYDVKSGIFYFASTAAVLACGAAISMGYKEITGEDVVQQEAITVFLDISSVWARVGAVLSIAILAPVAEELFFRGLLYRAAKHWFAPFFVGRYASATAAVFSAVSVSLVFAFIHASAFAFFPIFLMGLLLTCSYERTGSITSPIVMHSLFNIANILILCVK